MTRYRTLAVALVATTALGGAAYAADQSAAPPMPHETPAQKTADKDVGKLSADGGLAFRDLHLTRIAIFNANPNEAKTMIGKAKEELAKAKSDESVFMKAEADLKPPPGSPAPSSTGKTGATADMKTPVAWLPVDGQLSLGEDFVATPQKAAAVADANKTLASGDQKSAVEKLKLAGIDVNYTLAVLPLAKTTSDVDQAAQLIDQSKYYEANAVLKQAEDGMRFDMVNATGVPQKSASGTSSAPAATAPASPAKPTH